MSFFTFRPKGEPKMGFNRPQDDDEYEVDPMRNVYNKDTAPPARLAEATHAEMRLQRVTQPLAAFTDDELRLELLYRKNDKASKRQARIMSLRAEIEAYTKELNDLVREQP